MTNFQYWLELYQKAESELANNILPANSHQLLQIRIKGDRRVFRENIILFQLMDYTVGQQVNFYFAHYSSKFEKIDNLLSRGERIKIREEHLKQGSLVKLNTEFVQKLLRRLQQVTLPIFMPQNFILGGNAYEFILEEITQSPFIYYKWMQGYPDGIQFLEGLIEDLRKHVQECFTLKKTQPPAP